MGMNVRNDYARCSAMFGVCGRSACPKINAGPI